MIIDTFLNLNPAIIYADNEDKSSLRDISDIEERVRKLKQNKFQNLILKLMGEKLLYLGRRKELSMLDNYSLLMGCILGFFNHNIDKTKFYMKHLLEQYMIYKDTFDIHNILKH